MITMGASVGMMLFMTLMSLVSMFNNSDRGKAVITNLYHQRLPYSYITGISYTSPTVPKNLINQQLGIQLQS